MTPYLASSPHRYRPAITFFSLLVVLSMMLAACGGGSSSTTTTTNHPTTLHVLSAPGQPNPDLFNPYFNTNQGETLGLKGCCTNRFTSQICIMVRLRPGWPPAIHTPAI
jgi:hypothetical protein